MRWLPLLCVVFLGCAGIRPGNTTAFSMDHGGLNRSYRLHVPAKYDDGTPTPLVIMLHGGFGTSRQAERAYGMSALADDETFLVAYPDGTGIVQSWNAGACCGPAQKNNVDDVGFVLAMIEEIAGVVNVDRARVYATGMSNGGMLSHRLACEKAEVFAAVAPVAGTLGLSECSPSRPVPVMHVHGTHDRHVPMEGERQCGFAAESPPAVVDTMAAWRAADACVGERSVVSDEDGVRCESQGQCAAELLLCTVDGGGHDWPGGDSTPPFVDIGCKDDGPQNESWDATRKIWEFLKRHRLP